MNKREGAIAASKYTGMYGPVRSNQHVRMTMRIDLNPEICKDYKETGYCGYGDTCKFLHDRSDYKSGWQLEKEWEEQQKKKQKKMASKMANSKGDGEDAASEKDSDDSSDSDDEEGLPFACLDCRTKWAADSNPVVTICEHYFCERCALRNYAKSGKCQVCGEATNGVFNTASQILRRLLAAPPEEKNEDDDETV
eukprot:Selendium_serpulae@DN5193_c0_g1_i4.p1